MGLTGHACAAAVDVVCACAVLAQSNAVSGIMLTEKMQLFVFIELFLLNGFMTVSMYARLFVDNKNSMLI
jgi:uncharacterized protein YsxB (DUF464 family)